MDIRQDYQTGKIVFMNGQIFTTEGRQDSLRQRLDIRLKTQKGSWFLNIFYGVDWFNEVFGDGSTKPTVDLLLQAEILKESLVDKILSFTSSVNNITRVYSCSFKVKLTDNQISDTVTLLANENGYIVVSSENGVNTAIRVK